VRRIGDRDGPFTGNGRRGELVEQCVGVLEPRRLEEAVRHPMRSGSDGCAARYCIWRIDAAASPPHTREGDVWVLSAELMVLANCLPLTGRSTMSEVGV
jgi:hypothetical protein